MDADVVLTVAKIFEGLPPETSQDFKLLARQSWYPPGTVLFSTGDACSGVFWVSSGQVSVSVCDDQGGHTMSHIAQPGEILGLEVTLCGEAYRTTARTEGPAEMNFISRDDFSVFLSSHAEVAFGIVQQLSARVNCALHQLRAASGNNRPKPLQ